MRRVIQMTRMVFLATIAFVFAAGAAYAQLPSIRISGPLAGQPAEPAVFEGSLGGPVSVLTFTIELSAVPDQDVSALFSTFTLTNNAVSGTNCANANTVNGTDFIGVVNQPVFIAAHTDPPRTTASVTVCRDNQIEFHQNFAQQTREDVGVQLTNPVNAVCTGAQCFGFGHIFDDDSAPFVSAQDATAREVIGHTRLMTFTVSISHPHPGFDVRVGWATRPGTARAAGTCAPFVTGGFPDYVSASGSILFPAGDMDDKTFTVTICGDSVEEPTETFFVDLTNQGNADVITPARGSILDFALPSFGTFVLNPDNAHIEPREWLTYHFQWTVSTGVWRDLKSLQLRIRRRQTGKVVLWTRWLETPNTLQLCRGRDDDDDDTDDGRFHPEPSREDVKCGPAVVAGTDRILHSALGWLDVGHAKVIGSGPTGPSVVLELPVAFKRGAAGHEDYDVEVAAESDSGIHDRFLTAGVLAIKR